MVSSRPVFLLAFAFFISAVVHAQQSPPPPPPVRDPAAVAAMQRALAALGGSGVLGQVSDCIAQGTIQVPPGSALTGGNFVWKNAGEEFRYEYPTPFGTEVFTSGHGRPGISTSLKATALHGHMALASFPPHLPGVVLLKELLDPSYALTVMAPALVAGRQAIRVRTCLDSDPATAAVTPQEWLFDASTGLPMRVEYRWPDNFNAERFLNVSADLGDYHLVAGILVPFRIAHYVQSEQVATFIFSSVTLNNGLSPTDFDFPTGGVK